MTSSTTDRRLGLTGGTAFKAPCRVATTANITLSGEQTIDGVACVTGDRVLVKNQTTTTQNGIYVVDTGTWTRDLDFDGTNDIRNGTLVYVIGGTVGSTAMYAVSVTDPVTFDTSAIAFNRLAINNMIRVQLLATASQTVFNLGTAYQSGGGGLLVFVNGSEKRLTTDYTETSSTSITFTSGLSLNDKVDCIIGSAVGNLTAALASSVSVSDANDLFVGTTVEAVLAELAGNGMSSDNGNADATLTYGTSPMVQQWNTTLTTNRSATLSTTNAKDGAQFFIVRRASATGQFALWVATGGVVIATMNAPGEWCQVTYRAGATNNWVVTAQGFLHASNLPGIKADCGDVTKGLTVGIDDGPSDSAFSYQVQRYATTLTAARTVTLPTTGALWIGASFLIVRDETATGNFPLIVSANSVILANLAPGQWVEVQYSGTAWLVIRSGLTRNGGTFIVELYDDFLGEEIQGTRWQSITGTEVTSLNAVVRADQLNGVVRLFSGSNATQTMAAGGVQMNSRLNWEADKGCLSFEARVSLNSIQNTCVFVGLTDQTSALEMPFTMAAGDALTSNATDAVGVLYDTAADTDVWWMVGVAADVDATKQNSGSAPVLSTFETWRIDINTAGAALFYRNGTLVGSAMSGAVTTSVQLTPVVAIFTRTAANRAVDVDFIRVQQMR
jgi:hypothetical protein